MASLLRVRNGWLFGRSAANNDQAKNAINFKAQFGDFYNGAQVQLDTMVASGESQLTTWPNSH